MSMRPVIFISAVSTELRSARTLVARTLGALGYDVIDQDFAATDAGDLLGVLRTWVDKSDAVLQLVGHCYGCAPHTPDPAIPAPNSCPYSFTQYEALYAREKGKHVYYLFTDEAHPTDGCACEPKTLHELQEKYRKTVATCGDLYHSTSNAIQTELLVRRLKDDLAVLREEARAREALMQQKADEFLLQQRSFSHRLALLLGLLFVLIIGFVLMLQAPGDQPAELGIRKRPGRAPSEPGRPHHRRQRIKAHRRLRCRAALHRL